MDEIELIDSIWKLVQKSPWGIAPFSDSLLHWEQANKHLACTREVWIWFIEIFLHVGQKRWFDAQQICMEGCSFLMRWASCYQKKESNSSSADQGMVSGKTRTSMALTWPRLWRDVQSRGSEFDLMAMPGWHEGLKEVELWILCVGSRGSTSYWAGCLRDISFRYPSQIRFFECLVLMSWVFISTLQYNVSCIRLPWESKTKGWSFGWSLYRIPPIFCSLDFLILHIILSLTYP